MLINILLEGILQPVFAAAVAFIACPVGTFIIAIGAFLRKFLRDGWDAVMYQVPYAVNIFRVQLNLTSSVFDICTMLYFNTD